MYDFGGCDKDGGLDILQGEYVQIIKIGGFEDDVRNKNMWREVSSILGNNNVLLRLNIFIR